MIKHKCFTSLLRLVCNSVAFVFILVISSFSFASEKNIAVLDIDYVISQSDSYKALKKQMDDNYAQYKKEIAEYENEIINLDKKINKEKDSLTEQELTILKSTLNAREISIQRLIQKRRISLDENHSVQLDEIKKELYNLIKSEAEKQNFQVILSKTNIIYSDESLDISDLILSKFNESYKK